MNITPPNIIIKSQTEIKFADPLIEHEVMFDLLKTDNCLDIDKYLGTLDLFFNFMSFSFRKKYIKHMFYSPSSAPVSYSHSHIKEGYVIENLLGGYFYVDFPFNFVDLNYNGVKGNNKTVLKENSKHCLYLSYTLDENNDIDSILLKRKAVNSTLKEYPLDGNFYFKKLNADDENGIDIDSYNDYFYSRYKEAEYYGTRQSSNI